MKNPLNIQLNDDYISFPLEPELVNKTFQAKKMESYLSSVVGKNQEIIRYTLFDCVNVSKEIIIECEMISGNDYSVRYFEKIDKKPFDIEFLNIVGTSPLGYNNPKFLNIGHLIYDKVKQNDEIFSDLKMYVSEEEAIQVGEEHCSRDEDGIYYIVDRSKGSRVKIDNKDYFTWLYERTPDGEDYPVFLLLEIEALESDDEYNKKKPLFYIYEGKKLLKNDIQVN